MTSGSCCETDENGNTNLGAVVITAHRPGSSRWKNFLNNVKNLAIESGKHIAVFGLNALGIHANNNVTFGTVSLLDAEGFGRFEGAARFGRLVGNITSIIQGTGEDFLAVGGERYGWFSDTISSTCCYSWYNYCFRRSSRNRKRNSQPYKLF